MQTKPYFMEHLNPNHHNRPLDIKFIGRKEDRLILESKSASIWRLEQFLYPLKVHLEINESKFANILISLSEAVTNSITHGNKFRPNTYVWVSLRYSVESVILFVEDEGNGFNYKKAVNSPIEAQISKMGGRGIHIMKVFTDSLHYSKGGKSVALFFYLK